jgi:hypothetical protein
MASSALRDVGMQSGRTAHSVEVEGLDVHVVEAEGEGALFFIENFIVTILQGSSALLADDAYMMLASLVIMMMMMIKE